MKSKKTKDGCILVFENEEEVISAISFLLREINKESQRGKDAFGQMKSPYDLNIPRKKRR